MCVILLWLWDVSYSGGCSRIVGSFVFNRKRNLVELELKQESGLRGAHKYAVSWVDYAVTVIYLFIYYIFVREVH